MNMTMLITCFALVVCLAWFIIEKSRRRTHSVTGGLQNSISVPYEAEVELYSNSFSHCS